MRPGHGQPALSCDESQGLPRAVARHEDADLLTGYAALAGTAAWQTGQ